MSQTQMEAEQKANRLAKIAKENQANAQRELRNYTIQVLNSHRYDNLGTLIEMAVKRGFAGVEWIDFLGCGVMDKQTAISWAKKVIIDQKLKDVVEPYFNCSTSRLGIVLTRDALRTHNLVIDRNIFTPLPLELREWRG
jgi:hypothetical protein